jgi:hypothetical protein
MVIGLEIRNLLELTLCFTSASLEQNKSKKDKLPHSTKEKTSIIRSVLLKGDLGLKSVQSTSLQRKNERAKQLEETKASSSQNAGLKGDQSLRSVLPVATTLSQAFTMKEKEISSNAMETMTLDTKKYNDPNANRVMTPSSHFDKLYETAAPEFEDMEARLHESRGPVFEMGSDSLMINQNSARLDEPRGPISELRSNSLIINQNLDCEGVVVSETINPTFAHEKKGNGTDFQESSGNVDSATCRQMPIRPPKIGPVSPFDVSSRVILSEDPFAVAASYSNAIPTSESAFFGDNFVFSFPNDRLIAPKTQQSRPKPDFAPDDNADAGKTTLKMVDTVSSDEEEDVDKLAKTIVCEFQNELLAVSSDMTTYQDKARHAVSASHRESDSINSNSNSSISKLRAAPSQKHTVLAEDSTDARDNAPLQVVDTPLSVKDERSKELAKTTAGEVQNELQGTPSDMDTSQDKARDLAPASCMESDNVNTNPSRSNDNSCASPLSSLTSPILFHRKRIEKKQRRKQLRESPLELAQKSSDESKLGPSDKSKCDPSSTDHQTSQTSEGTSTTHLGLHPTAKRHSVTSNKEKPQSDVIQLTNQHVNDDISNPLFWLHSSIHCEQACSIALKQRRTRVSKKPATSVTLSPEKRSQPKGREKSDDKVVPKVHQASIMASPRASKSKPEITGNTAGAQSPVKSSKGTLLLEKQPESKEREKGADGIIPEAQKHLPAAVMISCFSDTRSPSKGTMRNRSSDQNWQSRHHDNASSTTIPDRKPLQPFSPNNKSA